ncbi:MAG: Elongation factor Ts, partial [Chlamydiae bacterium]|nr:Elongation factor Ts [Chlamydiota bacterium]
MSHATPQLIKELRERTGVGMGKCKVALEESGGNIERAIENLRNAGMASTVKHEGREATEGLMGTGESD